MAMLRAAVARVRQAGFVVVNADVVVVAETPKIGPYRTAMRDALAKSLGTDADRVSIKGKTNELMGWIGRGEGLACVATVLIARSGG
jgi:2-C-methyl-D-erythritol 2,4-cyclodiphosphate synthase